MSTTAGRSYSYTLPQKYRGTTTSISTYKNLENYGPCQGGTIVAPIPVTSMPDIFLNLKPHSMPQKKPFNNLHSGAYDYGTKYYNHNSYSVISQPTYTCGGLENEPAFRLGFNDITSFNLDDF